MKLKCVQILLKGEGGVLFVQIKLYVVQWTVKLAYQNHFFTMKKQNIGLKITNIHPWRFLINLVKNVFLIVCVDIHLKWDLILLVKIDGALTVLIKNYVVINFVILVIINHLHLIQKQYFGLIKMIVIQEKYLKNLVKNICLIVCVDIYLKYNYVVFHWINGVLIVVVILYVIKKIVILVIKNPLRHIQNHFIGRMKMIVVQEMFSRVHIKNINLCVKMVTNLNQC
ncbi:hypothetical protein QLL95_gp0660 [Cotonvirus japonicus]|uniref:Transmembrane protein n=1 Tax=Cotonvirus japonicus TaxID=2811091 RepID=A0ABM7NTG6_9VIRU|nr:hypothetical protein QLL95_gp0660 [Cotonvirus japonicus]BCS83463.1 hypothetical protein [Cotonvirus japonicus]